jgi:hypothetical protein
LILLLAYNESRIRAIPDLGARMMNQHCRLVLLAGLVLTSVVCGTSATGPSESLAGNWTANHGGKNGSIGMVLQQNGDEISGFACATNTGITVFSNVPVRGNFPNVQFEVAASHVEPCCGSYVGNRFTGRGGAAVILGVFRADQVRFETVEARVCR